MAFSLAHRFNEVDYHFSLLCKTLSHPARITIIRQLLAKPALELSVAELSQDIPLSQPTISGHLKMLRDACIVTCRQEGHHVYYRADFSDPNVIVPIVYLLLKGDLRYDENFRDALNKLSARRMMGNVPV